MTTSDRQRFTLRLSHLGIAGAFLGLWLGPGLVEQMQTQFQTELEAQQPEPPPPQPSQQGSDRFLESVRVRANSLLSQGREAGDVQAFITEHYQIVTAELADLEQQAGVFDGDAALFARMTNLSAEQQALELVQFWLEHPDQVKTVAGMSLSPIQQTSDELTEVDYANVEP